MSPLDDYHSNQGQNLTPSSPNPSPRKEEAERKNKSYFIIVAILMFAVIGGGVYFATRNTTSSTSNASQSSSSQSSVEVVSSSSSSNAFDSTTGGLTQEEITDARKLATDLAGKTTNIDPEEIINNTFTSSTIEDLKKELGSETPTLKIPSGKIAEITVKYSSIGDSDFINGSLYVKLSEGLTLVPASIKDSFMSRNIEVNESVYNPTTKLIVYGPGSSDKTASPIKVGESGNLKFRIQVDPNATGTLAVASYLKEENGKIGQPSIFFVDTSN